MIQITFSFPDAAAAAAMLAQLNGQQLSAAAVTADEKAALLGNAPPPASAVPTARSKRTAEAAPSTPAPSPVAPAPTGASSDAQPTAAAAPAPSAPSPAAVTYPDLQKAVLTLHRLDPTAAVPIAKSLGADTFKALKPEQWAEAHRLVTEAIAARG